MGKRRDRVIRYLMVFLTSTFSAMSPSAAGDQRPTTIAYDNVYRASPEVDLSVEHDASTRSFASSLPASVRASANPLARHRLGPGSEVIGWRTGERWYFGRHRSDKSQVGFVWQRDPRETVIISHQGIHWTKRF